MRTFCIVVFALLLVQGPLLAGGIIPVSRWKTHPILIDGKDGEWEKPINFYDTKTRLFFAIRNDSTTLYLNFTATDQQKMADLMNGGWTLSFATKNRKSKTHASLTFEASRGGGGMNNRVNMDVKMSLRKGGPPEKKSTSKQQGDEMPDETSTNQPDTRMINDYILGFRSFKANGFIFTHDEVPFQNTSGIVVRVGKSDPTGLFYEIAIPLRELYEENSVKLNELISMVISVNASAKSGSEKSTGSQSGGGPGGGMSGGGPGGGGPGGGGPGGGGPGGGGPGGKIPGGMSDDLQGSSNSSSEKVIFKQKFKLSSH
jgi:hypothetical protein